MIEEAFIVWKYMEALEDVELNMEDDGDGRGVVHH